MSTQQHFFSPARAVLSVSIWSRWGSLWFTNQFVDGRRLSSSCDACNICAFVHVLKVSFQCAIIFKFSFCGCCACCCGLSACSLSKNYWMYFEVARSKMSVHNTHTHIMPVLGLSAKTKTTQSVRNFDAVACDMRHVNYVSSWTFHSALAFNFITMGHLDFSDFLVCFHLFARAACESKYVNVCVCAVWEWIMWFVNPLSPSAIYPFRICTYSFVSGSSWARSDCYFINWSHFYCIHPLCHVLYLSSLHSSNFQKRQDEKKRNEARKKKKQIISLCRFYSCLVTRNGSFSIRIQPATTIRFSGRTNKILPFRFFCARMLVNLRIFSTLISCVAHYILWHLVSHAAHCDSMGYQLLNATFFYFILFYFKRFSCRYLYSARTREPILTT